MGNKFVIPMSIILFIISGTWVIGQSTGTWQNLGNPGFESGVLQDFIFEKSNPYISYGDAVRGEKASVTYHNGSGWVGLGNSGFSSGRSSEHRLSFFKNELYIAYKDDFNSNQAVGNYQDLYLKKLVGNQWVAYTDSPFNEGLEYIAGLQPINDELHIGFGGDYYFGCALPYTAKYFSSTWYYNPNDFKICDQVTGTKMRELKVADSKLYVSYDLFEIPFKNDNSVTPYQSLLETKIVRQDGSNWTVLGNLNTFIGPPTSQFGRKRIYQFVIKSGTLYAAIHSNAHNSAKIVYYNGSNWQYLGDPNSYLIKNFQSMVFSDALYFASENNDFTLSVKRYNGSSWQDAGASILPSVKGSTFKLATEGQNTFLAFQDFNQGGRISVLKFSGQGSTTPSTQDIIKNGGFSNGTTSWSYNVLSPSVAAASTTSGQFYSGISFDSGTFWHITLKQNGLSLESGKTYTLTYTAKSEAPRTLSVELKDPAGKGLFWQVANISGTQNTYTISFANTSATGSGYELIYYLGGGGTNDVWLDDVKLTTTGGSTGGGSTGGGTTQQFTLTQQSLGGDVLFDPPGPSYAAGTNVTIRAVPISGKVFTHWSGDASGTNSTTVITMNSNKNVIANFGTSTSSTGPVSILGNWVEGASINAPAGNNRALVVMLHAEHPTNFASSSVFYGGQQLKKVQEVVSNTNSTFYSLAAIYMLEEAKIKNATNTTITANYSPTPNSRSITSVFLGNVDQSNSWGANSGVGHPGTLTIALGSPLANQPGDLLIFAGTSGSNGGYTLNNGFSRGVELSSAQTWGDGIAGYKIMTGNSNEIPSLTQSTSMRQSLVAAVFRYSPLGLGKFGKSSELGQPQAESNPESYGLSVKSLSKDQISFSLPEAGEFTWSIYTLSGVQIGKTERSMGNLGFNTIQKMQNLVSNQTYLMKLSMGSKTQFQKIIVK